tara:strand:- start:89 stop:823 length:735 start_codon:yes stop_codon:yes gene_type:complete
MKTLYKTGIIWLILIFGCSKTPEQLLELSNQNIKNQKIDLAIKDINKLLKKYPNDSLASKAQYKLVSIYLNWKNDPESGYRELQNTVKKYESTKQGQEAKREIQQFPNYILNKTESLRTQKLQKEAVNHLMFMLDNFPDHEIASKAQYMLGDIYMNDFRDFTTAIQEYRKVLEKYAKSQQEPHALFMIGYIYANIMNDEKSAEIEYKKFLKRFPKHELAPSVEFEIKFLGKSIEEIPALKHITS